jgi:glycine/D-amino acid oxidase-like deaminating enzyme
VIGRDRARPRVVHALGWCGHGLALSLASGAWVARLLDGAPTARAPRTAARSRRARVVPRRRARAAGEALRWLSFRAAVGAMAVMDRIG